MKNFLRRWLITGGCLAAALCAVVAATPALARGYGYGYGGRGGGGYGYRGYGPRGFYPGYAYRGFYPGYAYRGGYGFYPGYGYRGAYPFAYGPPVIYGRPPVY